MTTERPFSQELWDQTPGAVQDDICALEARVIAVEAAIQSLEATVRHLTERLQQNSRPSSRPPSSPPPPALGTRPRREPSGRWPGGQPGHEGHTRALVALEAGAVVRPRKPERCRRCQPPLGGEDLCPQRHQVTDIPPVRPVVTEYQGPQLVCPACGEVPQAEWPVGVPTGGLGPRVQASAARCTGASHLSKRTTQSVREDLFGVSRCVGTIVNLERATVQAVAEPVAEARRYVPQQAPAALDDTGWREGRQRAWLWTAVTAYVTGFVGRLSRRATVAHELLGEHCWGYVVTDRWSAYCWYPTWRRQGCWAQRLRDIDAMIARGGQSREMGEALRGQARQLVHRWHRVGDGPLAHASFAPSRWPIRQEVERLLDMGQTGGVPKTEGVCRELLNVRQAWWTLVRHEGVEPTNNAAERALRPGGLWRKGRGGPQRPDGSRVVETIMTVVATLKPQHGNVLD